MIMFYWCPTCRELHAPDTLRYIQRGQGQVPICPQSGAPVELRGVPDDPDDPNYRQPRCPRCKAATRPGGRFCPSCGATLDGARPAPATPASRQPTQERLMLQATRRQALQAQIARLLTLIAERPGWRTKPAPGDPPGDFTGWFDGGAQRQATAAAEYLFADGARALVADTPTLQISVELPGGARVSIQETHGSTLSSEEQLLALVVHECRELLAELRIQGGPTECALLRCAAASASSCVGPPEQSWLLDSAAGNVAALDPAAAAPQPGQLNGMFYSRASARYCVNQATHQLILEFSAGPRFGRGLAFTIVEHPDVITLERPTTLWVA